MEMRSCSVRMKNLIKVRLSEGGGVQLDFPLKRGGLIMNVIAIKYCVSMHVMNLVQDFLYNASIIKQSPLVL